MRQIKKAAVLGAGVMGATIAAHLANAGLEVLLLDIVPKELSDAERAKGLTEESPAFRNRLAADGLKNAVKGRGLYHRSYEGLVQVGNFEDDIAKIRDCDWVVEVVVENMAIKKAVFEQKIVPNLGEGAILSTNTSGLSVNELAELLPAAVRKNFLVTHFFNPPRYMRLLEIVPCRYTDPEVVRFMADFCSRRLGKGIVYGKDTPNFVANRIGCYAMLNAMRHMQELGMTVEEIDAVAGPATARAGSATFRTCDLVGIDTMVHICKNSYELLPDDEDREIYIAPEFVVQTVGQGLCGNKTGQGFFKKEKVAGQNAFFYYDYQSGEYKPCENPKFDSVLAGKKEATSAARLKAVVSGNDRAAEFAWRNLRDILIYTVNRMPEIADDVVNVDNGMKWGYSWELGPFEMLDAMGVAYFVERAEADGLKVPAVLKGVENFYKYEGEKGFAFDLVAGEYREIPQAKGVIDLKALRRSDKVVKGNADASLLDLGDGVFCLEFHSKMNAIDSGILEMIEASVDYAEQNGVGLVIGNRGRVFSAGANLAKVAESIKTERFDEIDGMIRGFHSALMRVKYSSIPVVAAPFNMALGGGCEVALQADAMVAHAETYMGLVEIGVGLLPAGGGTKEMAVRAIEQAARTKADVTPYINKAFMNIAMAKVSGSAAELTDLGYLRENDSVTMDSDRLIADAKQKVLALATNYRPKQPLTGLKAPGVGVAAGLKNQLYNMQLGNFVTAYEAELGGVIADVITGGDVPGGTLIGEQYLLDLEREGFIKLCRNEKTLERIEHMLKTGKPLRN